MMQVGPQEAARMRQMIQEQIQQLRQGRGMPQVERPEPGQVHREAAMAQESGRQLAAPPPSPRPPETSQPTDETLDQLKRRMMLGR